MFCRESRNLSFSNKACARCTHCVQNSLGFPPPRATRLRECSAVWKKGVSITGIFPCSFPFCLRANFAQVFAMVFSFRTGKQLNPSAAQAHVTDD